MDKITISSDKLIGKIVSSYNGDDQKTVEIQHGQYILFADCRFIRNSFCERDDGGFSIETNRLSNFYIYEASLYKDGEFIKDKEWDFDGDFHDMEREIFEQLKSI